MAHRSSILFLVPDAEPLVGELRRVHDPAALAGIGAHITLLFPFAPAPQIDRGVVAALAAHFARCSVLELVFDRVERFPGLAYLALAEAREVIDLVAGLGAAWPDYPPYEGRYPESVPHVTVALGDDAVLDAVARELARGLPLATRITHASLYCEDEASRWSERARFALGG